MKKNIILVAIAMLCFHSLYAQKTFHVKLIFDTSIHPQKIDCHYYDGLTDIFLPDTFSQRTATITGKFYSQFVPFFINNPPYSSGNTSFFLTDKPATIYLYQDSSHLLNHRKLINAKIMYDTLNNKIYDALYTPRKQIAESIYNLFNHYGSEVITNDSLKKVLHQEYKSLNTITLSILKQHPVNFFSFWYFRSQVIGPSLAFFSKDTSYLKSLISYFKKVFPVEYTNSLEGKALIEEVQKILNPPGIGDLAPEFSINDIQGENISLKEFRGKYVLLDFWASWCSPCMAEIPFLREIRKNIEKDSLVMISINSEPNIDKVKEVVRKDSMNWINIYDLEKKIFNLYGIRPIPEVLLINKEGKIIFRKSQEKGDSQQKLLDILKGI